MNENQKQEILIKLKSLSGLLLGNFVLTTDMGLQFDYASAEGCGTSLGNMGEWPVYRIHDKRLLQQWSHIISKIESEELTLKDISGTVLEEITLSLEHQYGSFSDKKDPEHKLLSLSEFYAPLTYLSLSKSESFYLMIDSAKWELDKLEVSSTTDEARSRFEEKYCYYDTWESLDDESLVYWYNRINNDLEPFDNFL